MPEHVPYVTRSATPCPTQQCQPTTLVDAVVPVGNGVGHWGGDLSLTFRNDPKADQKACEGATVKLTLTSN